MELDEPTTLPQLVRALAGAVKDITDAHKQLPAIADGAGEIIAGAYELADADDSLRTSRGNEIQRILLGVGDQLVDIVTLINAARSMTKDAIAAMDEAEARRKVERAKLGV